jgi:CubicO group peptidase (beta-lactamase class C family)
MKDASPQTSNFRGALQPYVDKELLAGAVTLVASREGVLSLEAVGFADIAARKPMAPDALFWIASQTKPMTVTALMMLADEGKVNVDDAVEKYLPEFKGQMVAVERDAEHVLLRKPGHPMKVREILTHTSGLPFASAMEVPTRDLWPLCAAAHSYAMTPLDFEPGTKFQYSNAGTNVAGRIIEVLSGMPYEEFLRERLLDPLGMTDTTFVPSEEQVVRLAKSYGPGEGGLEEAIITQLRYPLTDPTRQPLAAGGLFSTAEDVAKFCRMIANGGELDGRRYVSEAAVTQMTSNQTGNIPEAASGFGWFVDASHFWHGGAYNTYMRIERKRGLITVYLVQHAGFPAGGEAAGATFQKMAEAAF